MSEFHCGATCRPDKIGTIVICQRAERHDGSAGEGHHIGMLHGNPITWASPPYTESIKPRGQGPNRSLSMIEEQAERAWREKRGL